MPLIEYYQGMYTNVAASTFTRVFSLITLIKTLLHLVNYVFLFVVSKYEV